MTFAQLRHLLAIVDAGLNISLAAERANATQSGLSKQLKQLEDELALQLFVRRGRNLDRLTTAGVEIVERGRAVIAGVGGIRAFAASQRGATRGSLFIETTHIQAQFALPRPLAALRARFPEVDVALGFAADADDVARRNPDADLVMFSTDGRVPPGDVVIPLYHWDPVAVVPSAHPLTAQGEPISLQRLAAYPLITYDTSKTAPLSIARTFREAGLAPRFAYTARDAGVTKAAVRDGTGVGLLAEMAIGNPAETGLATIALHGLFPRCTTWAVLRRDRGLRDYVAFLASCLSGLPALTIRRMVADGSAIPSAHAVPHWKDRRTDFSDGVG